MCVCTAYTYSLIANFKSTATKTDNSNLLLDKLVVCNQSSSAATFFFFAFLVNWMPKGYVKRLYSCKQINVNARNCGNQ